MSELVKSEQKETIPSLFDPNYIIALEAWAERFSTSDMVPDFYKAGGKVGSKINTPEKAKANCLIAIDMAARMGASPIMVMQNMKPIMGNPTFSAQFIIALINNSGQFEELEFKYVDHGEISNVDYTDYRFISGEKQAIPMKFAGPVRNLECVCVSRRKSGGKELVGTEVSIEMAIKEGWYTKNGSKWPTMPKLMLMYRAATFWKSQHAPQITLGLPSTEEIVDARGVVDGEYTDVTASEKIKDAAKTRRSVSIVPDEPKAEEKQPEDVDVASDEPEQTEVEAEKPTKVSDVQDDLPAYMNDGPPSDEEDDDDDMQTLSLD